MPLKLLLLVTLIAVFPQQGLVVSETPPVSVINFKWSASRLPAEKVEASGVQPVREVIAVNKNYQRNVRVNDPRGARDPNADTLDGRSAELERVVQESRTARKPIDGFTYRAKVHNIAAQVIEVIFWEYDLIEVASPENVSRRQFLCGVNIRPEKDKDLEGFSVSGPTEVVSLSSLAKGSAPAFQDKILINRVEFTDGAIWQRKGWNFSEVRLNYERVIKEPWALGMCKSI